MSLSKRDSEGRDRWLLLIHQVPPKPDYLRVKVRRRLERIGAVPLKNSVYVLPSTEAAAEDFQWLAREITADGGEASVCGASFIKGISDAALIETFRSSRNAIYRQITNEAREIASRSARSPGHAPTPAMMARFARLKRRFSDTIAIDYFGARGHAAADQAIRGAELRVQASLAPVEPRTVGATGLPRARTWVTRRDVHVDRMASAWLIRRFIDPRARFKFVAAKGYKPLVREFRFDMFEPAEGRGEQNGDTGKRKQLRDAVFTHDGERCTFETLLVRFALDDPALRILGQMVHDIDFKLETFGHAETASLGRFVAEVGRLTDDDARRVDIASAALDVIYVVLAATSAPGSAPAASPREGDTRRSGRPSRGRPARLPAGDGPRARVRLP